MNKNLLIKKSKTLLIFAILSFININLFAQEKITSERLGIIWRMEDISEKLTNLEEAIPQVAESGPLLTSFAKILQDLVIERKMLSEDETTQLKTIISRTLYHQKVQQAADKQFVTTKKLLSQLLQRVQTPLTFSEEMRNLRLVVVDPERRKRIQENPDTFMNTLTTYVTQRAGKTEEEISQLENLLKTVRASGIFTNPDHKDQQDKLIEMVPLPTTLYEEIYKVYLEFKSGKINMTTVEVVITKYQKASKEDQEKSEEILTLLLKSIIYNLRVSKQGQTQASKWLRTVVLKEEMVEKKEPETYSEKVDFCVNQAFNPETFENPQKKAVFLTKLSELVKQKINATPQDLEKLVSVLNYLDLLSKYTEFFDKTEKLQVTDFLSQVEKEMSVSEKLSIIFSSLGKLATDSTVKDTILKLVQDVATSIINTMAKDKKVPDETATLKNLITVYLLEQPIFAANKTQIEKWLADLKKAEEEVVKPTEEKPTEEKPQAVTPIPFARPSSMMTRPSRDTRGRPGMAPSRPGVPSRAR